MTAPSPPRIFDRALIARRLARRAGQGDFVTGLVLADLSERLLAVSRAFARAAIVAPDASLMPATGTTGGGAVAFARYSSLTDGPDGQLDAEAPSLPGADYDLIVSVLDLQVVDDVPGYLARMRRRLVPDGLFLAATLGGSTLTELRQAVLSADAETWGGAVMRVAPFIDVREAGALLQRAGFALPVVDRESHIVRYASALALMAELKALGAANPLVGKAPRPATRGWLTAVEAAYGRLAGDADGRVSATLEVVWLSGWAPDPSQQKPLTPGSAKLSLADVLKDRSAR